MARHGTSMALRPIHRIKHVVDLAGTLTAGTQIDNQIARAVDAPVLANTFEVETGSKINGIYLKVEVASNETDAGAIPNVYMALWKNPANALSTAIDPTSVGSQDTKRFVIHQEMVMLNNLAGGNPRVLFNGVVVIPKGMRRFGPDDKLNLTIESTAVNIAFCLQAHYKEFR